MKNKFKPHVLQILNVTVKVLVLVREDISEIASIPVNILMEQVNNLTLLKIFPTFSLIP